MCKFNISTIAMLSLKVDSEKYNIMESYYKTPTFKGLSSFSSASHILWSYYRERDTGFQKHVMNV